MLNVKLKVIGGDFGSDEIDLALPATLGRGRDVCVNLSHPLVSRRHCELVESDGRVLVRDLDSLNGTFVGSEQVREAALNPGDLLTVGTVTFRAVYEAEHQEIAEAIPVADTQGDTCRTRKSRDSDTIRLDPAQVPGCPSPRGGNRVSSP